MKSDFEKYSEEVEATPLWDIEAMIRILEKYVILKNS